MCSTCQLPASHGPPQVVARAHLLDQLALPLVLHLDARSLAGLPGDVGAAGELVRPLAVLPHEDDPGASAAYVLDDRLRAAVTGGERLDAGDQAARGDGRLHRQRRIGTICHALQRKQTYAHTPGYRASFVILITDRVAGRRQCTFRLIRIVAAKFRGKMGQVPGACESATVGPAITASRGRKG